MTLQFHICQHTVNARTELSEISQHTILFSVCVCCLALVESDTKVAKPNGVELAATWLRLRHQIHVKT